MNNRCEQNLDRTTRNARLPWGQWARRHCRRGIVIALGLACGPLWPAREAAAAYFSPRVEYDASLVPYAVAIGDLNNDGIPDMVATHDRADSLSVYFGIGSGTFEARKTSYVGANAHDLVIGKFNNDAWADVALLTNGTVVLCLGDGTGFFGSFLFPPIGVAIFARMAAGDLNLDGNLDLVATNQDVPGKFFVLLGSGDGTFQPYTEYPTRNLPLDIILGDFYQDGTLDVAITFVFCCPDETTVSIFPGIGDGRFDPAIDTSTCSNPSSIASGDLNADGKLDFVVACPDQRAAVRLGVGNGTFQSTPDLLILGGGPSTVVADVTGDGKLDAVIVSNGFGLHPDSIEVFPGSGNGFFGTRERFESSGRPNGIAAADLDGDAKVDLVTANEIEYQFPPQDGTLSVFLNCAPCIPTSISVALQDAGVEGGVVHLRWVVPDAREAVCTVFRRTAATDWVELGPAAVEAGGFVGYEDRSASAGTRYAYRLLVQSARDLGYSDEVWILVPANVGAPLALRLDPVFPNPFQTQTRLNFAVPGAGPVQLAIFDVAGRHVATVLNQEMPAGWRSVSWNGTDRSGHAVPSGTYFAKLEQSGRVQVRKVLVSR